MRRSKVVKFSSLATLNYRVFNGKCLSILFRWAKQHEYLEKLNMQAVMSASNHEDEFVKEFMVSYDKVRQYYPFLHTRRALNAEATFGLGLVYSELQTY